MHPAVNAPIARTPISLLPLNNGMMYMCVFCNAKNRNLIFCKHISCFFYLEVSAIKTFAYVQFAASLSYLAYRFFFPSEKTDTLADIEIKMNHTKQE